MTYAVSSGTLNLTRHSPIRPYKTAKILGKRDDKTLAENDFLVLVMCCKVLYDFCYFIYVWYRR